MKYIRNGTVRKFDKNKGPQIKIEKRDGFRQASREIRDVTNGSQISTSGFPAIPTLFSSLGTEQVISSNSNPFVLAEDGQWWSQFPYVYTPTVPRQTVVYTSSSGQVANPDSANIGGIVMRTWSEPNTVNGAIAGAKVMITDSDGTPILQPTTVSSALATQRAKCVSDGSVFWIVYTAGPFLFAKVYDVHGVQAFNTMFATLYSSEHPFDVTFAGGHVLVCQGNSDSDSLISIFRLTNSSGVLVATEFKCSDTILGDVGCAWAENTTNGSQLAYLLTAHYDADGGQIIRAFQITNINATISVNHYYGVGNSSSSFIFDGDGEGGNEKSVCQLTGYGFGDLTTSTVRVQASFFETTGTDAHLFSRTAIISATQASASGTLERVLRSIVMASHTFTMDGRQVAMAYYPSAGVAKVINGKTYPSQPSYFLIDLVSGQVCGRFNEFSAGMEWTRIGYPTTYSGQPFGAYLFCVGHVITYPDASQAVSLGYLAQNVNEQVASGQDIIPFITLLTSTVGFEEVALGGLGQAIEYANELIMPGPQATSFTGYSFGEQNCNLPPEQPTLAAGTFGGDGITLLSSPDYIAVFERTNPNGDKVRSGISVPIAKTLSGSQNQITLTGPTLHMTTYDDWSISIYRAGLQGTGVDPLLHHKVTDDLNPVINDRTAKTWTFTDHMQDSVALANEILYTDQGQLDHAPCPPFSVGCVFENRVFVAGLDNAIWFSAEKVEGDALWFSADPSMRIPMPTSSRIKQLAPFDLRIAILTERQPFTTSGGGFPGPDGNGGNVETPRALPFTNGITGFSVVFPGGAIYTSSVGEPWLLTRGLENIQLGANAVDDFAGRTVVGASVNGQQQIGFGLAGDGGSNPAAMEIFDQLAKLWVTWILPTEIFLVHSVRGQLAYADHNTIWIQDPTIKQDVASGLPVPPDVNADYQSELIPLGGIKNFRALWDSIISGTYEGPHTLNVTVVQDSNGILLSTKYSFDPSATDTFQYSLPPRIDECSRISFRFQDNFDNHEPPGDSFTIEAISLYVATMAGMTRLEIPKVITPVSVPVTGTVSGSSAFVTVLRLNGAQDLKILPGATTFTFPRGLPDGEQFHVAKFSGPGTVTNPDGFAGNPQIGAPVLNL
jgi:hypothetical protein